MPAGTIRFCSQTIFLLFVLLLSCRDSEEDPAPVDHTVHATSLTIDLPKVVTLSARTTQLTAMVLPENTTNKKVVWSSSNVSVATVDDNGLVTAVAEGPVEITATSNDNTSIKATSLVTVLKNYDVHVVGKGFTAEWSNLAVYWKNGIKSALADDMAGSAAYAIVFSGDDEYIAGNIVNHDMKSVPIYWKNREPHYLSDFAREYTTYSNGIAVDGDKVYLAGYSHNSTECPDYCFGRSRAWYITDVAGVATQTDLFDDESASVAYGVAVRNNDVFVTGGYSGDNFYRWSTLWKNTLEDATELSPLTGYYEATAIIPVGDDLYMAAHGGCADVGCNATVVLMKNNSSQSIALTDGSRDARAHCIAAFGNVLYVGGHEVNAAGVSIARYWKIDNGIVTTHILGNGTIPSSIHGIAVRDNDLFIVGTESSDFNNEMAKCWRVYEGSEPAVSFDVTEDYTPGGNRGYGIAIR